MEGTAGAPAAQNLRITTNAEKSVRWECKMGLCQIKGRMHGGVQLGCPQHSCVLLWPGGTPDSPAGMTCVAEWSWGDPAPAVGISAAAVAACRVGGPQAAGSCQCLYPAPPSAKPCSPRAALATCRVRGVPQRSIRTSIFELILQLMFTATFQYLCIRRYLAALRMRCDAADASCG